MENELSNHQRLSNARQQWDEEQQLDDYQRIEQAIRFLEANRQSQPSLKEAAQSVSLSEYHFQRLFTRWVGISPKRFLQYLTKEYAKGLLARSEDVLTAAYQVGLSGPGRLHDLFVTWEALSPGEYKKRGAGLQISYGFHATPFGECLLASTGRGICSLVFLAQGDQSGAIADLKRRWGQAELIEDAAGTAKLVRNAFAFFDGSQPTRLHLHVQGTNFQLKVWEALLNIPSGSVVSYQNVALQIGAPGSARAVSNAVANNPIPVVIPCHRVIRKAGETGGYRWGRARKLALLGWEAARVERLSARGELAVLG